ncbi:hypothetical protein Dsin_014252 [Dipteronia sinensis]|uniref:Uncharacterized protein n=1 Tax=Dipteronia sinensis TaxID=43782 RepID=A0AAE0EA52_9ROSI|nr:hypothetical protein Dsin_014252 [Dipteronia sinensis]
MYNNCGMDAFYQKQALKFIHVCLVSQLNLPGNLTDERYTPRQLSSLLVSTVDASWCKSETSDMKADLEPDLNGPKDDFVVNICHHFAMIFHTENISANASIPTAGLGGPSNVNASSRSKSNGTSNLKELDPLILIDALADVLTNENSIHAKAALTALNMFAEMLMFLAC